MRAIAETADVNGSSDVSGVDEGNVVVKIRGGWRIRNIACEELS